YGVDRHAGLADVADHPRVVAVEAAVGGQVEGDREAHLPGGQVGAVEGVGLLGGGEARVLADGPRLPGIHGGARGADEWEDTGERVDEVEVVDVGPRPEGLHVDALG